MELKYVKSEKGEVEVEIPNLTLAEILREYLTKDSSVDFVAWKKEHHTVNPVLRVKGKDAKAAIKAAASAVIADLDSATKDFKLVK